MAKILTTKQLYSKNVNEYRKNMRKYLLTSRFNEDTWNENKKYREENANIGCIYCCPDPVSQKIPAESIMFILEMNNDTNKIMGIGMVRNKSLSRRIQVYKDGNYNRYVYTGKLRISREEMNTEEETIMKVFDQLCFKGNRHMKRGQGLKSFPIEMLYNCSRMLDLVDFISKMFKTRLSDKYEKETN
jgi:hypothetical protein